MYSRQDEVDSSESRWTCGPMLESGDDSCDTWFDLNTFRYIRQIQLGESWLANGRYAILFPTPRTSGMCSACRGVCEGVCASYTHI